MEKEIQIVACEEIPAWSGLKNTEKIIFGEDCEWYGHACATLVARKEETGTVESFLPEDQKNGNTAVFERLRKEIHLIEKARNLVNLETVHGRQCTDYFVPYKVKDHCSGMPTVMDATVDNCSNVQYDVSYEILLIADENIRRYITVDYQTEGSWATSFFDEVESIEDNFTEWFEEGRNGFKLDDDDEMTVLFYDDLGRDYDVRIDSMSELLNMITSIRVIKCERTIIDQDKRKE